MIKFDRLKSKVIPLPIANVDTDQIIPARFLKAIDKDNLAAGLFADWCYGADGVLNPAFVLNQPQYKDASILLARENFGCGSSREHAVWALTSWGIRAVIAPSFADIFRNNSLKNGLLPVELDTPAVQELFNLTEQQPDTELEIDLLDQTITSPDDGSFNFPIDAFAKRCLLNGQDQLEYLLSQAAAIDTYERNSIPYWRHSWTKKS
ncbi:MAG: 3-isopropylmalate dehydratase small subunit [Anaerolineales bacterium]|jgi:3-isopropylmalate/(R)-2-methylmalate dehydratase small subunit